MLGWMLDSGTNNRFTHINPELKWVLWSGTWKEGGGLAIRNLKAAVRRK